LLMQHFLYFNPLPHGQGSFRPVDIVQFQIYQPVYSLT